MLKLFQSNDEMIDFVRIPEKRLKFLKENKKLIKQLEDLAEVKIELNEEVSIETEDSLKLLRIKEIIKAFGRGFEFDVALNLLDESYQLEIINIKDFAGKSRERSIVLKGRAIGSKGKTKNIIEKYTNTKITIYGKTISILGKWDDVMRAKQAVEMLLSGSKHTTVYKSLEGK